MYDRLIPQLHRHALKLAAGGVVNITRWSVCKNHLIFLWTTSFTSLVAMSVIFTWVEMNAAVSSSAIKSASISLAIPNAPHPPAPYSEERRKLPANGESCCEQLDKGIETA